MTTQLRITAPPLIETPPDTAALQAAWDEAQTAFRAMLDAKSYPDPEHPLTIAYVRAERRVDDLLGELQWESSKAEWDRLQAADLAEFAGDHIVYPAGVGR